MSSQESDMKMADPKKSLFDQLKTLTTEQRNPASMDIDARTPEEIVRIINSEDKRIPLAVESQIPYIARSVELVVKAFVAGGRLVFVRARTAAPLGGERQNTH